MSEPDLVLVVDDEPINRKLAQELLTSLGYRVEVANDGEEAVSKVRVLRPDLIMLDVMMPRLDGLQACRLLKQDDETRLIPVVLLTALSSMEDRVAGIEAGADDFLTKPFNKVELLARVRSLIRLKHRNDQLERTENVLFMLAAAVEAKDPYTEGHLHRLEEYASQISSALNLPARTQHVNRIGALLHDIGKIGIPEAILNKPGKLTPEEFAIIKEHPEIGERICSPLSFGADVGPIVRGHHERWDGGGYPDGLAGEAIPLGARIVAVADAFDAMTTDRPYRKALALEKAWEILREGAGKQWDAAVVEAFASAQAGRVGTPDRNPDAVGALHQGKVHISSPGRHSGGKSPAA